MSNTITSSSSSAAYAAYQASLANQTNQANQSRTQNPAQSTPTPQTQQDSVYLHSATGTVNSDNNSQ